MNAIFTICAKNYLAQAKTLGYSIKKYCADVDFFILLSDEIGNDDIKCSAFNVIEGKNLNNIEGYYDMAFKYDVIEFSTSIKPYYLDILLNEKGYDKVLYIDPDMVVYNSLDTLFDELDHFDAILTPHLLKPYVDYQGATSEEELLFVGIYNLGFFGIKNSTVGKQMTEWWKVKLKDQCYADKEDALHVDQKWMDFLPSLYGDQIRILRHPGVNLAFWNMHEREFLDDGENYSVDGFPLIIFHFSGFSYADYENIAVKQTKHSLTTLPQYRRLFESYVSSLKDNDFIHLRSLKYTYNYYENDIPILKYQRRLYRMLTLESSVFSNPFSVSEEKGFFNKLKNNKLMVFEKDGKLQAIRKSYGDIEGKINKLFWVLNALKSIVGIKRYYLLMKFISIYNRFEKQPFLIKK